EMAIEETVEMCAKLEAEFGIKAQSVLMNLVSPLATASEPEIDVLRQAEDPALRFAFERGLLERERAAERRGARTRLVERPRPAESDRAIARQSSYGGRMKIIVYLGTGGVGKTS